jgi:hypothetical protein
MHSSFFLPILSRIFWCLVGRICAKDESHTGLFVFERLCNFMSVYLAKWNCLWLASSLCQVREVARTSGFCDYGFHVEFLSRKRIWCYWIFVTSFDSRLENRGNFLILNISEKNLAFIEYLNFWYILWFSMEQEQFFWILKSNFCLMIVNISSFPKPNCCYYGNVKLVKLKPSLVTLVTKDRSTYWNWNFLLLYV